MSITVLLGLILRHIRGDGQVNTITHWNSYFMYLALTSVAVASEVWAVRRARASRSKSRRD
jgi:hypothetical protein